MRKLNVIPAPLIDIAGGWSFPVITAGLELGVFDTLHLKAMTPQEAAQKTGTSEKGMALLLQALELLGYVSVSQGHYQASRMAKKWMCSASAQSIAGMFPHFQQVIDLSKHLANTVTTGEPTSDAYAHLFGTEERADHVHRAMRVIAGLSAPEVLKKVKLRKEPGKMIDLGGSHGWYSVCFCRKYPSISSALILDWVQAKNLAEQTIGSAGMSDRISFQQGDYHKDDLGGDYDLALMMNLVHMHSPEQNLALLEKVSAALNPDGTVVIMEQTETNSRGNLARAVSRLQALSQLNINGGTTYSADTIRTWLVQTGFPHVRYMPVRTAPGCGMVIGQK